MYRNSEGALRFSFTNLLTNSIAPGASNAHTSRSHITTLQKDLLYTYQISLPEPLALTATSLSESRILGSTGESQQTYLVLQRCGVVSSTDGTIDTTKINGRLLHMLPKISILRQKAIVDALFWWEEECMRLRKLHDEQYQLETVIAESMDDAHGLYPELLSRVKEKIGTRPSWRDPLMESDRDELMLSFQSGQSELPSYSA